MSAIVHLEVLDPAGGAQGTVAARPVAWFGSAAELARASLAQRGELPAGFETFTCVQMNEFYLAHGVEMALDYAAALQREAGLIKRENAVVRPSTDSDNEGASRSVDTDDGPGEHARSLAADPALQALLRRGRRGIAAAAITGNVSALDFWKGFCEALNDLTKGVGARAAEIDAASGECDQQTGLEAAVASLPECTKRLTLADVQQLLAAHGVKLTPDRVPNVDIGSGLVLEHRVLAGLQPNDEHPIARVDARDYSNGHLSSPSTCNSASLVELENATLATAEGRVV